MKKPKELAINMLGAMLGFVVVVAATSFAQSERSGGEAAFRPATVNYLKRTTEDQTPPAQQRIEIESLRAEIRALRAELRPDSKESEETFEQDPSVKQKRATDTERLATLETHFQDSNVDVSWAVATEGAIDAAFRKIGGAEVLDAECREISCRTAVKFNDPQSRQSFIEAAFEGPFRGEFGEFPIHTDEGTHYVYYSMRDGHALGEVFFR